jgi:hypothetical protein
VANRLDLMLKSGKRTFAFFLCAIRRRRGKSAGFDAEVRKTRFCVFLLRYFEGAWQIGWI